MPKKVKAGWIAAIDPSIEYTTQMGKKPTAVYVHGDMRHRAFLDYAGIDDEDTFEVPCNTDFLRDLAAAITAFAEECDKSRIISN